MHVGEIVLRKKYCKQKIDELKLYIDNIGSVSFENSSEKSAVVSGALKNLFEFEDEYRTYVVTLDNVNIANTISINDQEITILQAIRIIKNIQSKIDVLNRIISGDDYSVSYSELFKSRDTLVDELILLSKTVHASDWGNPV